MSIIKEISQNLVTEGYTVSHEKSVKGENGYPLHHYVVNHAHPENPGEPKQIGNYVYDHGTGDIKGTLNGEDADLHASQGLGNNYKHNYHAKIAKDIYDHYKEHLHEGVLNELSKTKLRDYINKAVDDVSYHSFSAGDSAGKHIKRVDGQTKFTGSDADKEEQLDHDKKAFKRQKGIVKAANKLGKDEVDESVLNELSKTTLKSYLRKSVRDLDDKITKLNTSTETKNKPKLVDKIDNRGKNIKIAKEKLTKESLDEGLRLLGTHSKDNKSAKVYKDHEWQEHRVKFYTDGAHHTEADYHTNDKEDAHSTAKHWVGHTDDVKEATVNELSQNTLKSYVDKANTDLKSKEAILDRTPMNDDVSGLVKKMNDRTNKMVDAKRKLPRGNPYDVVAEASDTMADTDQDMVGNEDEDITADQDEDIVSEMEKIVERHLSSSEEDQKEEYVHAMKKNLSHFIKKYGKKRGKSVMYAVATKMAKNESIDADSLKEQLLIELSKKTLGSYIEKAVDVVDDAAYSAGTSADNDKKQIEFEEKSIEKRKDGIKNAVKKLTKEGKESEHGANLELAKTKDAKKKGSLDDYLKHNEKSTKKKEVKESNIVEGTNRTGERPVFIGKFLHELTSHPMVEKVVNAHYLSDGATALVRMKDGNAYEIIVTPARFGKYHQDVRKADKFKKRNDVKIAKARANWGWDTSPKNPNNVLGDEE